MQELRAQIKKILEHKPFKIVLSNQREKSSDFTRTTLEDKNEFFQAEKQIGTQMFHENMESSEIEDFLVLLLSDNFRQLNAFDGELEHSLRLTKKEKILFNRKQNLLDRPEVTAHNRKKNYILQEGSMIAPLIDMGVFTKEGKIVASMYDKFKQINRFIEVVDDTIKEEDYKELTVIDFGCGKSYLTFLLYYYFTQIKNIDVTMIGLDLKEDVIEQCNIAAKNMAMISLHLS